MGYCKISYGIQKKTIDQLTRLIVKDSLVALNFETDKFLGRSLICKFKDIWATRTKVSVERDLALFVCLNITERLVLKKPFLIMIFFCCSYEEITGFPCWFILWIIYYPARLNTPEALESCGEPVDISSLDISSSNSTQKCIIILITRRIIYFSLPPFLEVG